MAEGCCSTGLRFATEEQQQEPKESCSEVSFSSPIRQVYTKEALSCIPQRAEKRRERIARVAPPALLPPFTASPGVLPPRPGFFVPAFYLDPVNEYLKHYQQQLEHEQFQQHLRREIEERQLRSQAEWLSLQSNAPLPSEKSPKAEAARPLQREETDSAEYPPTDSLTSEEEASPRPSEDDPLPTPPRHPSEREVDSHSCMMMKPRDCESFGVWRFGECKKPKCHCRNASEQNQTFFPEKSRRSTPATAAHFTSLHEKAPPLQNAIKSVFPSYLPSSKAKNDIQPRRRSVRTPQRSPEERGRSANRRRPGGSPLEDPSVKELLDALLRRQGGDNERDAATSIERPSEKRPQTRRSLKKDETDEAALLSGLLSLLLDARRLEKCIEGQQQLVVLPKKGFDGRKSAEAAGPGEGQVPSASAKAKNGKDGGAACQKEKPSLLSAASCAEATPKRPIPSPSPSALSCKEGPFFSSKTFENQALPKPKLVALPTPPFTQADNPNDPAAPKKPLLLKAEFEKSPSFKTASLLKVVSTSGADALPQEAAEKTSAKGPEHSTTKPPLLAKPKAVSLQKVNPSGAPQGA